MFTDAQGPETETLSENRSSKCTRTTKPHLPFGSAALRKGYAQYTTMRSVDSKVRSR